MKYNNPILGTDLILNLFLTKLVMSSSDEDRSPLYPKGKKFYSDKYITTSAPANKRRRLCIFIVSLITLCILILITGVVVGVLVNHVVTTEPDVSEPWMSKRLPSGATPDSYAIKLDVDLESLVVVGEEDIIVSVKNDSKWILLQALSMNITDVAVTELGSSDEINVQHRLYPENDYLIVENENGVFSQGKTYNVRVKFTYFLYSGGLAGFYNSTYNENGKDVILATTQFEATDARKAFPCFDEPEIKSIFNITIVHPSEKIALSNMPVESQKSVADNINRTETTFETSPKMSTYLVAFIVCNFKSTSKLITTSEGKLVNVSVWSRPSLVKDTEYALNVSVQVLLYYETFFNISYPLPKMDLVAIPDFASGAMENWGLITYRETALLYSNVSSASDKQWVTQVIAHELAHQWFGNLVTMEWWQDLWLNEGFATYVEYLGTNIVHPDWHYLDYFIIGDLHRALEADGYNDTHPIIQPAETQSEINALFDSISYSKGASLIRMIAGFMEMSDFQKGLTDYLNAHLYGNARSADLWSALQGNTDPSDYNLTAVMDTWTIQAGYPVLEVKTSDDCTEIDVTQKRFAVIPTGTEFDYKWQIPFTYITDKNASVTTTWIKEQSKLIALPSKCEWIKANKGQLGFYRVNYEEKMWGILITLLQSNFMTFSIEDRANLVDDSIALSLAGELSSVMALNLTSYLQAETDYIPWRAGLNSLWQIRNKLVLSKASGHFSTYIRCLMKNQIQSALQNWSSDNIGKDHLADLKLSLILKYALLSGDSSVGNAAYAEFRSFMINKTEINPDLISLVFTAGIKLGSDAEWNHLWNLYLTSENPTEQESCLSALAYAEKPWLIQLYLDKSLSEVRSQDRLTVLRRMALNVHAWPYLWSFFKENYDVLFSKYGQAKSFGRAITAIISHFSTQGHLDDVESFFSERDVGAGEISLNSGMEKIKANIQWISANLNELDEWLSQYNTNNNCM